MGFSAPLSHRRSHCNPFPNPTNGALPIGHSVFQRALSTQAQKKDWCNNARVKREGKRRKEVQKWVNYNI